MDESEKESRLKATTRPQRFLMYGLIGGQHLVNLLVRFALPFFVPFLVQEFGITDAQRAAVLAAFTPGYVLTQIPAAGLIARVGAKKVLVANNLGLPLLLLALPTAASISATALWTCVTAIGALQGPFIAAQSVMTSAWVPKGVERPAAIYIIRLGGNIAKLMASAITPTLCSAFGWRTARIVYGGLILLYAGLFATLAREMPAPIPVPTAADGSPLVDTPRSRLLAPRLAPQSSNGRKLKLVPQKKPFTMRLLTTKPAMAIFWAQLAGMMCEFNLVSAWAPTYFHESLGVPLANLGRYTSAPMMLGIWFRALVSGGETALLAKGKDQLLLRKAATAIGGAIASASLIALTATRSSFVAMMALIGVTMGNSFNQSGITPNYIEVAGPDAGYFGTWMNTLAWAVRAKNRRKQEKQQQQQPRLSSLLFSALD